MKIKLPQKARVPGTVLPNELFIVDASGRLKWLPAKADARQRFIDGVRRKVEVKKGLERRKRLQVPKTLPRRTVLKILEKMGFEERSGAGASRFHHPTYRVLTLPAPGKGTRTGDIIVRRGRFRRVVEDYLLKGRKI